MFTFEVCTQTNNLRHDFLQKEAHLLVRKT